LTRPLQGKCPCAGKENDAQWPPRIDPTCSILPALPVPPGLRTVSRPVYVTSSAAASASRDAVFLPRTLLDMGMLGGHGGGQQEPSGHPESLGHRESSGNLESSGHAEASHHPESLPHHESSELPGLQSILGLAASEHGDSGQGGAAFIWDMGSSVTVSTPFDPTACPYTPFSDYYPDALGHAGGAISSNLSAAMEHGLLTDSAPHFDTQQATSINHDGALASAPDAQDAGGSYQAAGAAGYSLDDCSNGSIDSDDGSNGSNGSWNDGEEACSLGRVVETDWDSLEGGLEPTTESAIDGAPPADTGGEGEGHAGSTQGLPQGCCMQAFLADVQDSDKPFCETAVRYLFAQTNLRTPAGRALFAEARADMESAAKTFITSRFNAQDVTYDGRLCCIALHKLVELNPLRLVQWCMGKERLLLDFMRATIKRFAQHRAWNLWRMMKRTRWIAEGLSLAREGGGGLIEESTRKVQAQHVVAEVRALVEAIARDRNDAFSMDNTCIERDFVMSLAAIHMVGALYYLVACIHESKAMPRRRSLARSSRTAGISRRSAPSSCAWPASCSR